MSQITVTAAGNQFRLAFSYDAAIVAAVKSLPSRRFDPASKSWSVPVSAAAALKSLLGRQLGAEAV